MKFVEETARVLEKGGIVIFPTETVCGIGCLLTFPDTIERLYKIKNRPSTKPSLALFSDISQVKKFVEFDQTAEKLAKSFWPGPLTIVLPAKKPLPKMVVGKKATLGTRIPNHPWLRELLKKISAPLLAPSANFSGQIPPFKLNEVDKQLSELVDYVVNIEPGGSKPTTVVDLSKKPLTIVREGTITKKMLDSALGKVVIL